MPVVNAHPHLLKQLESQLGSNWSVKHTFRNVLRPARILPPIQVEYFRSGGANIFILMSLTANFCNSVNSRSPKPFVKVLPPESTMLLYSDFRRSRSVRLMASTTIWCTPGYSRPMISGSKRISGALKRSAPICVSVSRGTLSRLNNSYLEPVAVRKNVFGNLALVGLDANPFPFLPLWVMGHV